MAENEYVKDDFILSKNGKTVIGYIGNGYNENIVIPDGIEKIGKHAFVGKGIKSIKFPDTLLDVGVLSFANCRNLEHIDFGNGIKNIGDLGPEAIFSGCVSLTTIEIPSNVKSIGRNTFYGCENLEHIIFHDGIQAIAEDAFKCCEELTEIELPSTVHFVGCGCFPYVSKMKLHGDIPHGLIDALNPENSGRRYWCDDYPKSAQIIDKNGECAYLPKYILNTNKSKAAFLLNSGIDNYMQMLYSCGSNRDVSHETAYSMYTYLLTHGKEPCKELKTYVKRASRDIVIELIEAGKTEDAITFMKESNMTKTSLQYLYDYAVKNGESDFAAYVLDVLSKNKKTTKKSMRL